MIPPCRDCPFRLGTYPLRDREVVEDIAGGETECHNDVSSGCRGRSSMGTPGFVGTVEEFKTRHLGMES